MSPKKYIVILGGIVVISAFVLIYLDSEKANTGINPSTLDPGVSLSLPGQTSTTTRVAEDVEAPLPPVPDLDRPLVFSIETPELTRSQINVRRNDLVLELKENPNYLNNWLDLGAIYKTAGDYEGAAIYWEYASLIRPKNYVSFSNLGYLYHFYVKDYPRAELNLKKSVENEPTYMAGYRGLYDLYTLSYREKLGEVPKILNYGLAKNPNDYNLLILLAQYYRDNGMRSEAKTYYEKALAVAPPEFKMAISEEINKL